jgi:hypothetical protein
MKAKQACGEYRSNGHQAQYRHLNQIKKFQQAKS